VDVAVLKLHLLGDLMTLQEATEAYQAMLEGHRAHPDDELIWEDLCKARQAMEIAWLNQIPTHG
jgi:hypothetical protein